MGVESHLRWRCRRGIKEMDLLLENFLTDIYPQLNADEQNGFEHFLDEADLDIYSWIMGKSRPANPDYQKFVTYLQQINPRGNE